MEISKRQQHGLTILRMKNDQLELEISPETGGRIISIRDVNTGYQFLWRNKNIELGRLAPGSEYDPNFFGGIDELLPNDIPENINGIDSPDHGELWTAALDFEITGTGIVLHGRLPLSGLIYRRKISFCDSPSGIALHYTITNPTGTRRAFMWKLHAALNIAPGDMIICPARKAVVADPQWSRWNSTAPFAWPHIADQRADIIPASDGSLDFLYLYDLDSGIIGWQRPSEDLAFAYRFDTAIFPYCLYFASYGGFYGHYTAVLEPCTTMPYSVNEAEKLGQCSILEPGASIDTTIHIYAGSMNAMEHGGQERK